MFTILFTTAYGVNPGRKWWRPRRGVQWQRAYGAGGGVEIVGELLREAALTCLKVLLRVCTHNRSIYLNCTQATFAFGLKSDACRTFRKATPVWTVKSDLIRLWSHWNATDVSSALEEAGPGKECAADETSMAEPVSGKRVKSVSYYRLLVILSVLIAPECLCTVGSDVSWRSCSWVGLRMDQQWRSSRKPLPSSFFFFFSKLSL